MSVPQAEEGLARALARGTAPADAAQWIEGFLSPKLGGSGLVLATSARKLRRDGKRLSSARVAAKG